MDRGKNGGGRAPEGERPVTRRDAQALADLIREQIDAGLVLPAKIDIATGLTALDFGATPQERAARWETRARRAWNALAALGKQRPSG